MKILLLSGQARVQQPLSFSHLMGTFWHPRFLFRWRPNPPPPVSLLLSSSFKEMLLLAPPDGTGRTSPTHGESRPKVSLSQSNYPSLQCLFFLYSHTLTAAEWHFPTRDKDSKICGRARLTFFFTKSRLMTFGMRKSVLLFLSFWDCVACLASRIRTYVMDIFLSGEAEAWPKYVEEIPLLPGGAIWDYYHLRHWKKGGYLGHWLFAVGGNGDDHWLRADTGNLLLLDPLGQKEEEGCFLVQRSVREGRMNRCLFLFAVIHGVLLFFFTTMYVHLLLFSSSAQPIAAGMQEQKENSPL